VRRTPQRPLRPPRPRRICGCVGRPRTASPDQCDEPTRRTPCPGEPAPAQRSAGVSLTRYRVPVYPACCPPTVSTCGHPFPPPGPVGRFPGFAGTTSSSDFRHLFSRCFFLVAPALPPCACDSLPSPPSTPTKGQGTCVSGLPQTTGI